MVALRKLALSIDADADIVDLLRDLQRAVCRSRSFTVVCGDRVEVHFECAADATEFTEAFEFFLRHLGWHEDEGARSNRGRSGAER